MMEFFACPRRYAFRKIEKIEPEDTPAPALDRGTAFHHLVETGGRERDAALVDLDPFEAARVTTAYAEYKALEDSGALPSMTHREVKIVNEEAQFLGYVDMIAVDDVTGKWRLGELKTTMKFDPMKWATLRINTQICLYTAMSIEFAHAQFLDMADMEPVSYRTVLFSGKKPLLPTKSARRKTAETPEEFEARIKADPKVYHQLVAPDQLAIRSALHTFEKAKEGIDTYFNNPADAPKNPGSCHLYNRACDFFEHCWGMKPELPETALTENDLDKLD